MRSKRRSGWRGRSWLGAFGLVLAAAPAALAQQRPTGFVLLETPQPVAAIRFTDEKGRQRQLADFHGKAVLLNVWAAWCAPCRKELPALDRLEAALSGTELAVIAVSVDRGGIATVRRVFGDLGVRSLAIYVDSSGQAMRTVKAIGLPVSLIVDREGRELGRMTGAAEWDAPETLDVLRRIVSAQNGRGGDPSERGGNAANAQRDTGANPAVDRETIVEPRSTAGAATAAAPDR